MKYIILPSSGEASQARFRSSIANGIPYNQLKGKISDSLIKRLSSSKSIAWGFIDSAVNRGKWERLENGDTVVFYRQKRLFYVGKVAGKIVDRDLALNLWGDDDGKTWDLVFFITDMVPIDRAWKPELMGYQPIFFPQAALICYPGTRQYGGIQAMIEGQPAPTTRRDQTKDPLQSGSELSSRTAHTSIQTTLSGTTPNARQRGEDMPDEHVFKRGDRVKFQDGSFALIIEFIASGGQGEVYKVENYERDSYALKWYYNDDYSRNNNEQYYDNLVGLVDFVKSSNNWFKSKFTLPLMLTEVKKNGQYGFLMDLIPDRMVPMGDILKGKRDFNSFKTTICACKNLSYNIGLFHNKYKKSFKDLNDGSIFVNLDTGDVMICDCDNLAAEDDLSTSIGKMGFMAPEICKGEKCTIESDLHSLAVILYYLLLRDHPLDGKRIQGMILDPEKELEIYGTDPVFVFDPKNRTNPPRYKETEETWNDLDPEVRERFTTAFTIGLHDPSKRVSTDSWAGAFERWKDSLDHGDPFAILPPVRRVPKRIQHIIFIVDSSDSMRGPKMDEVNRAVKSTIPELKKIEESNYDTEFRIDILQFSRDARWYYPEPVTLDALQFKDMETTGPSTQFHKACIELDRQLKSDGFIPKDAICRRPIFILLSDGQAFGYEDYLDELWKNKIFERSIRVAIGIDDSRSQSDPEMLAKFTGDKDLVITTDKIQGKLSSLIRTVTSQLSRASKSSSNTDDIRRIMQKMVR